MFKKTISATLFFMIMLENSTLFGADFSHSNYTFKDNYAYRFVKSTCHMDMSSLVAIIESTKEDTQEYFYLLNPETYSNGLYFFSDNNIASRKGIGKNIALLLDTDGYYDALRECFPNSEFQRNLYTQNLLLFDAFGKIAALSIVSSLGYAASWGIGLFGQRIVAAPFVSIFRRAGASSEFLNQIPNLAEHTTQAAFVGLALVGIGYEVKTIAQNIREQKELLNRNQDQSQKDLQSTISTFQENRELYKAILKFEQSASPSDKVRIACIKTQQKENVQYYLIQILSHKDLPEQDRAKYEKIAQKLKDA